MANAMGADEPTRPIEPDTLVGRLLADRYQVERVLGAGGMGSVYLAADQNLNMPVVVKAPHPQILDLPGVSARFKNESETLKSLRHEHVVRITDRGQLGPLPYIVMEHIDGGSLEDRVLRQGAQSLAEVLAWLRPIAKTLDEIHARGFLHRDIKPANILFRRDGSVLISDFGIARSIEGSELTISLDVAARRSTTLPPCTPSYAGPEVLKNLLGPRFDQYSLGLTVYFALSGGSLPFPGRGQDVLELKTISEPTPIQDFAAVGGAVADALMKAIARDPKDRYGSCVELVDAISLAASSGSKSGIPWPLVLRTGLSVAGVIVAWTVVREASTRDSFEWIFGRDAQVEVDPPVVPDPVPTVETPEVIRVTDEPFVLPTASVQIGSTTEELQAAVELCRRYATSPDDCAVEQFSDETLADAAIGELRMDPFEVTVGDFDDWVGRAGYETTADRLGWSRIGGFQSNGSTYRDLLASSERDREGARRLPVVHVSLADAEAYCAGRGARLPTQEEWEFAARGPERRNFPWGGEFEPMRVVRGAAVARVGSIGESGAGWRGHQDLSGNVWEWTSSVQEGLSVLRGGSFAESNPAHLRSAARLRVADTYTSWDVGFRCVEERTGS